ncbi:MAG: hypothetical protein HQL69_02615 [Magnetococcales bacterium]|nr:hypothetical protein [Magnetococcales bacterium]
MSRLRSTPQYVLFVDLMMMILFMLILDDYKPRVSYYLIDNDPPPGSLIYIFNNSPSMVYDDRTMDWRELEEWEMEYKSIMCPTNVACQDMVENVEVENAKFGILLPPKIRIKISELILNECQDVNSCSLDVEIGKNGRVSKRYNKVYTESAF